MQVQNDPARRYLLEWILLGAVALLLAGLLGYSLYRERAKIEALLRSVIEQAPVGIALSRDGITLDANPVYLRMFGCDEVAQLRGKPLLEQIAPQCRSQITERLARRARGEPVEATYETTGLRRDGTQFPFIVSANRIISSDGPMTIAFFIDITKTRLAEEEIRRQLDELLRWQELMVGREERMRALKGEVNELLVRQGQPRRYAVEAASSADDK